MAEPHDASWSGDILGDRPHSSPLTIEEIIRVASFPIYRLIDRPPGLTLTSIGYCTADFTAEQADSAWFRQHPNRQQVVWQVVLRYDFLPPHKRHGRGIDVCTTEISKAPMRIPTVEAHSHAHETLVQSYHEVPGMGTQPSGFVILDFPFLDGSAVASVAASLSALKRRRSTVAREHQKIDPSSNGVGTPPPGLASTRPPARTTWSCALRSPNMCIEGCASGWSQDELFAALEQLGVVNARPEIQAQYHRELLAWNPERG